MNAVFGDTSAFLALLNATNDSHDPAVLAFATLRARKAAIVATSYVLVETYALLGRRLGAEAVKAFRVDFAPLIEVVWVDESLHNAGLDLLLARRKRLLSLVDAVSFITMRQTNLGEAFAFDPHFEQEGFSLVK
jgi:predicted nucleic acid-binding protein